MADEEASVQVAVRMRIFNQREKDANSELIIRMRREDQGSRTWVRNPETNEEKEFKYDYSFNSHNADKTDVLGPYATQDFVFQDLGMPVLNAALEGRDVTLFAYGQTGAGKSFSMLGKTDVDHLQGIIPRTCKQIFRVIAESINNPLVMQEVSIQVVEVYCEQINDLLADRKSWPPNGHKPKLQKGGGYGVDSNRKYCNNYDDIEFAFKFADKNRSVGSHALNPESSRAHTIYQICYKKSTKLSADATQAETVPANLNLVDLAGSERTESAGTSGQMLKEGNAINLSLTALGGCIKALSENAKQVNFRDSKLTLLLQRSMTSGRVIMIAAISPASICYEETVSTLRFAERIKMVKIKSRKNVTLDPVAEIKKEMEEMKKVMQAEIDNLRAALDGKGIDIDKLGGTHGGVSAADPEEVQELKRLLAEQKENEESLRKEIEKEIKASMMTDADRQASAQAMNKQWANALGGATMENKEDIKEPHLLNLNPEERLAETLIYKLKHGTTVAGRTNKDSPPDLEFSGMGMVKEHCVFTWDEAKKKVTLAPRAAGARCLVNGQQLEGPMELKHNDRVWLGNNYAFRFAFPGLEIAARPLPDGARADYYLAESEIAENQAKDAEGGSEVTALNSKLAEALKKVQQANIVADDLATGATFQPKIVANRETGENQIVVNVQLPHGSMTWPWAKFDVRLIEMVKMWDQWQHANDNGVAYEMPKEENPFVDKEYQLIGEADVWLQSLGNMIEVDLEPPVLSVTGNKEGQLHVTLLPLDRKGDEGPWDGDREDLDPFVDEPKELLNKEAQVAVVVKDARFDADLSTGGRSKYFDTWVRYRFRDTDAWTETPHDASKTLTPAYNSKSKFKFVVDDAMLKQITKGKITLQVWGKLSDDKPTGAAGQQVPPGWTRVQAWLDPQGNLHRELPKTKA